MNETLINATSNSLVFVNQIATRIIVGIIIFLVGLIIARILSKITQKVLKDFSLDGTVKKKTGIKTSFEQFISNSIFFVVMIIFLIISLNYVGITSLIINILSIAVILVVLVSLILSIKDNVPNILAHRVIRQKKLITEGDTISMDTATGVIEEISLFQVKICNKEDCIYIPNSLFLKKEFKKKKKRKTSKKTSIKKETVMEEEKLKA